MMDSAAGFPPIPPDDPHRTLTIADPATDGMPAIAQAGGVYCILLSGHQTGGRYCVIDLLIPPGAGPPPHRHDYEEMFTVLEGEITLFFRDQTYQAGAGTTVNVPANAPHHFRNNSDKVLHLLCMCPPPGLEDYFMTVADKLPSRTSPPPDLSPAEKAERVRHAKALALQYRTEFMS
jgi:quercetin dioxygenase-like cupin family protein